MPKIVDSEPSPESGSTALPTLEQITAGPGFASAARAKLLLELLDAENLPPGPNEIIDKSDA